MVRIITGGKNSGKTDRIKEIYLQRGGDGLISDKIICTNKFFGYKLQRLSTGESIDFIYENKYVPVQWQNTIKNKRYTFYRPAFGISFQWILEMLSNNYRHIYIDEVGNLELDKEGFYDIINYLIKYKKSYITNYETNLYITVRDIFLDQVIKCFNIVDYEIIET